METDYSGIGKIQYLLGQRGLLITDSQYTDKVTVETLVPQEELCLCQKRDHRRDERQDRSLQKKNRLPMHLTGKTPVLF